MRKTEFDKYLKQNAESARFSIDCNYIVFDKNSDLEFELFDGYKLGDFLTSNPLSSLTRLNKDLVLKLVALSVEYGEKFRIISGYRSPEFDAVSFCVDGDKRHTRGDCVSFTVKDIGNFSDWTRDHVLTGDLSLFDWGATFGVGVEVGRKENFKPKTFWTKISNLLAVDSNRNFCIYGGAALLIIIFLKKLF